MKKIFLMLMATCALTQISAVETTVPAEKKENSHREIHGKVEAGYTSVVLTSMYHDQKMDHTSVDGLRFTGTFVDQSGLTLKAAFLNATQDGPLISNDCDCYRNASVGIGFYLPVHKRISFIPTINYGITRTDVRETYYHPLNGEPLFNYSVLSKSDQIGIGSDVFIKFNKQWGISAQYSYAWSHSKNFVNNKYECKTNAKGPTYGISLDCNLNDKYTASIAFARGLALGGDQNGFNIKGGQISLARRF